MFQSKTFKVFLLMTVIFGFTLSAFADGFIVIPRPSYPYSHRPSRPFFNPFPMEVVFHRVDVKIKDQIALTSIDQVFYNPSNRRLEGYYLFPIPKNAVIKKFSMFINGREMQAELLGAKKARKIYEDIVRRMLDPALLEYSNMGVFKVRIFPIEPYSKKRIKISYREILSRDNNTIEYLYPLNTEKFSAKPLKDVSVNVEIKSKSNIKNIYCPTHKAEIIRKGNNRAIVSYEGRNIKPNIDFKLYYNTSKKDLDFSLLSFKKKGKRGYFFLSISPGAVTGENEIINKDITFVLDVSGSMAGKKLVQAKKAMLFCIENLNRGDRFEIIRFSTEAEALFNSLSSVNEKNLNRARKFIKDLRAIGGTNIDEALIRAINMDKSKNRPYIVIFLTDGKPTIGETNEDILVERIKKNNISGTRIFTFGIGDEINTHLLDKITELTKAYRTYISPEEDIEVKVSNFYSKVQSPILTDIKIIYGGNIRVFKLYPVNLPDLFKGSSLSILGRYKGDGKAKIILRGKIGKRKREYKFIGDFKGREEKNDFIPPLWASRRIGYLLDQIRLHGKDRELIDEVTELARTYGIITPYTSYLIVEDEKIRVRKRILDGKDQTLGRIAERDRVFEKRNLEEFSNMKLKSGSKSVQVSKEIQKLNVAPHLAQTRQGKSRLYFKDSEGMVRNVVQQIKNVQGRAVYNTGKFWVDSQIQSIKSKKIIRLQFASKEYFDLLKREPASAQFLALGKNVRFVLNDSIYEIHE